MNLLTDTIELQERTCSFNKCTCKFKVMPNSLQKYCSTNCMIRDNKLSGREKMHLGTWIKVNPKKTKRLKKKIS